MRRLRRTLPLLRVLLWSFLPTREESGVLPRAARYARRAFARNRFRAKVFVESGLSPKHTLRVCMQIFSASLRGTLKI